MHRSGTSALTRALNLLGAALPVELLEPTASNPLGFWEWSKAYRLHNELLSGIDSRWDDWTRIDPNWFRSPASEASARRLADMLIEEFADKPLFAVKDPRTCRFYPLWLRAADLAKMELRPILIIRHPLEVVGSLAAGKDMGKPHALLLWLRYVLDAEAASRGQTRIVLTYHELLQDWRAALSRTGEGLGLVWPRWTDQAEEEIDAFLSAEERHHVAREFARGRRSGVPEWVQEAYQALTSLARGDDSGATGTLDEVRAAFDVASSTFGPLFHANARQLERLSRKRQGSEETLAVALRELDQLKAETTALRAKVEQEQNAAAALRSALSKQELAAAERADLQSRLDGLQQELRAAASERTQLEAQIEGLQVKLERRLQDLRLAKSEERRTREALRRMDDLFEELAASAEATEQRRQEAAVG
jgi:hypothetical protein